MEKLTISPDLRARLNGLSQTLEMCDEAGLTLGRFVPEDEYRQFLWAWANSEVTEEELEDSRKEYREHGGMTTTEAIAYIKRLAGE